MNSIPQNREDLRVSRLMEADNRTCKFFLCWSLRETQRAVQRIMCELVADRNSTFFTVKVQEEEQSNLAKIPTGTENEKGQMI